MTIRPAQAQDAAQIAAIWNDVIANTAITFTTEAKTEAGLIADIHARGPGFQVLCDGPRVLGFATYFPFRAGPGYAFTKEHSIQLHPAARGQGAGRALMGALEAAARADGVHALWAGVSGENPAGCAFHARLGYAEIARLSQVGRKFDRWMDLILMQEFWPTTLLTAAPACRKLPAMSLWTRISEAIEALRAGEGLAAVFERLRTPPERSVAFTIAVIALSAKMAKADGLVTRDEVTAFRDVFHIAPEDERGAARVFNMARQDVAGYEDYARRIRAMFNDDSDTLVDLMEGLFHIAAADGTYHPAEQAFLANVAEILGVPAARFRALEARYIPDAEPDPYSVLGVTPDMALPEIRRAWRQLVRDCHPDAMMARGVPAEAVKLSERRMQDINRAWAEISAREPA